MNVLREASRSRSTMWSPAWHRCANPAYPSRGRGSRALDKSLVALLAGASVAFDTSSSISRWAAKPGSSNENTAKPFARKGYCGGPWDSMYIN
jgi:hypothetical protein